MSPQQFAIVVESKCFGESHLAEFTSSDREQFCIAAKKCMTDVQYVFVDYEIYRPQKREIVYQDRTEVRVVLKCPTEPPMLLMFQNLLVNGDVLVLIPKNESVAQKSTSTPASVRR